MPAPTSADEFLQLARKSGVLDERRLDAYLETYTATEALPAEPARLAGILVRDGLLTHFQAEQFLLGKWRRFTIGKYKVLERLGAGGMGSVYLCEHKLMRRRVAVKVLPTAKADDPAALERFYREARAVAALDHPNIVRAYDIDQDDKLHFLVMEHVDGSNLQEIVKKSGPLDPIRAAHYIHQAALGLQHAHESAGLVHRDIKPGNILVDRNGIVKVLDMGLARFFHDQEDNLTKKFDENVLGTADYLAPEQAIDSHGVDIRADIYSLGATFYFCLTGRTPFNEGSVAQKLIWHQTRQPKPVKSVRPETPDGIATVVEKAMSKEIGQRFATPQEMAEALAPWTQTPIPPPSPSEMPQLSRAAMGGSSPETIVGTGQRPSGGSGQFSPAPSAQRKSWHGPAVPAPTNPPAETGAMNVEAAATMRSQRKATPSGELPAAPPRPPSSAAQPVAPPEPTSAAIATGSSDHPALGAEVPSWDKLADDTDDLTGRMDTASTRRKTKPPSRRSPTVATVPEPVAPGRIWWVVGCSVGVMIVLLLGLWLGLGGTKPATTATGPRIFTVAATDKLSATQSFVNALNAAVAGDVIQLQDDITISGVDFGSRRSGITIQSAPGRKCVWHRPDNPKLDASAKLLLVNGCSGCKIQDVTFDGGSKLNTLATLFSECPGMRFENVTFRNYQGAAVVISSCSGTADRPVALEGCRFQSGKPEQIAVSFEVLKQVENRFISIHNCTFEGPGAKVVGKVGMKVELIAADVPVQLVP